MQIAPRNALSARMPRRLKLLNTRLKRRQLRQNATRSRPKQRMTVMLPRLRPRQNVMLQGLNVKLTAQKTCNAIINHKKTTGFVLWFLFFLQKAYAKPGWKRLSALQKNTESVARFRVGCFWVFLGLYFFMNLRACLEEPCLMFTKYWPAGSCSMEIECMPTP